MGFDCFLFLFSSLLLSLYFLFDSSSLLRYFPLLSFYFPFTVPSVPFLPLLSLYFPSTFLLLSLHLSAAFPLLPFAILYFLSLSLYFPFAFPLLSLYFPLLSLYFPFSFTFLWLFLYFGFSCFDSPFTFPLLPVPLWQANIWFLLDFEEGPRSKASYIENSYSWNICLLQS